MIKLNGIEGSSGIAIAKVFKITEPVFKIDNKKVEPKKHLELFASSLAKTKEQIKGLVKLSEENKKIDPTILEAHLQMLDDAMLLDGIKNRISEGNSASLAVSLTTEEISKIFSSMDDDYMKQRASDVKDIGKRLLANVLGIDLIDITSIKEEVILVADDITPSETAQFNVKYIKGFATNIGGRTSHSAIMARSLEIPAILGLKNILQQCDNDEVIIIDGYNGDVFVDPDKETFEYYKDRQQRILKEREERAKYNGKQATTKDKHQFTIEANIGDIKDIEKALKYKPDGVGLLRTEFQYMHSDLWPTEEEQFKQYKIAAESFKDSKSLVIRTLDVGGDKFLKYFTFPEESNPFLGYRAIRLCLDKKEIFKTQLRAILRASAFGPVEIMFPMIAVIEELKQAKEILKECMTELDKENIKYNKDIKVGMMVETPAVAANPELFIKHCDFFSIGTNDLIQYSFAVDRMSQSISYLYQPYNPSLLKMIDRVAKAAHAANKTVCICGEVAGESKAIPLLVGLGIDQLSMSATSINKVKKIICNINKKDCEELVAKAMDLETNDEVIKLASEFLDNIGGILYGKR